MVKLGEQNALSDIHGIEVGHASRAEFTTGVTVIRFAEPVTAAIDVRGGGPGTRETDLLAEPNLVQHIHAICFTGGSVFGLAAADGVVAELSAQGVGLRLADGPPAIPLVPAATLYDLETGNLPDWGDTPPYAQLGREALSACSTEFALGSVGAGTGARAGTMKGGIGTASLNLGEDGVVAALAAVNPVGSVIMPDGKTPYAWNLELENEFGGMQPPQKSELSDPFPAFGRLSNAGRLQAGANTTLGLIATNIGLTRVELKRVAMMAHDGLACAVRPAHLPFDGDTVFAVSTQPVDHSLDPMHRALMVAKIGAAAADVFARAIVRGVFEAESSLKD
jgi:L-aminopeptidase/D-esterase-like protein